MLAVASQAANTRVAVHRDSGISTIDQPATATHQTADVAIARHAARDIDITEGAVTSANQAADVVIAHDSGAHQTDIANHTPDVGVAKQADGVGARAVDGEPCHGMAAAVQLPGETVAGVAHRNEACRAPHAAGIAARGSAGIDIACQGVAGTEAVGHQLQLVVVADAGAVFAGEEGARLALDHDPAIRTCGVDVASAGDEAPGAKVAIAAVVVAVAGGDGAHVYAIEEVGKVGFGAASAVAVPVGLAYKAEDGVASDQTTEENISRLD